MPRRSRKNWPLWIGLSGFFLVLALFVAWPSLIEAPETDVFTPQPSVAVQVRERAMTALAGLWFFVFGASIGSFLNVVAYRMPIGLTIVSKPSRCPFCMSPIKFKHNVPILGWLALRGRCKACRLPISARYPLVELVVGMIYFTLFSAELASGGANLPFRTPSSRSGLMWNLFTPQWDLIGIYLFHIFLLGVLVIIALIKFDRLQIPAKLFAFAVIVGIGCPLIWPDLMVVPVVPATLGKLQLAEPWQWVLRPTIGLIAGALVGAICQRLIGSQTSGSASRCGSAAVYGLIGLYLGWQAIGPTLLIAATFQLLVAAIGRCVAKPVDQLWAASGLVGTWLLLCFWRQLGLIWLPSADSSLGYHAVWLVFAFAMVFVVQSMQDVEHWRA